MNKRVCEILAKYSSLPAEEIKETSTLALDCGLNSFEIVNIVMEFEDEFNIEIDDDKLSSLKTVADIISCIENAH